MITLEQVKEFVSTLPGQRSNPMKYVERYGHPACVYTGDDEVHCIGGEILSHFAFPLPDPDSSENFELNVKNLPGIDAVFDGEAIAYMNDLQSRADYWSREGFEDAWARAIRNEAHA